MNRNLFAMLHSGLTLGTLLLSAAAMPAMAQQACNAPVNYSCSTSATGDELSRSTVALIFEFSDGTLGQCSGSLIADVPGTGTGWIASANHCIRANPSLVKKVTVYYQARSACAAGLKDVYSSAQATGTASIVAATADGLLLKVDGALPNLGIRLIGWDATGQQPTSVLSIHHQANNSQQLVSSDLAPTSQQYITQVGSQSPTLEGWRIDYPAVGVTGPGSSGSALFTRTSSPLLVGLDSAGTDTGCKTWYNKWSSVYPAFKPSLDPSNTGALTVAGRDVTSPSPAPSPSPSPSPAPSPSPSPNPAPPPTAIPQSGGGGAFGPAMIGFGLLAFAARRRRKR